MFTIVVLHHKHLKLYSSHLYHMLLRGPSEKVLISRLVERKSRKRHCSV